MVDVRFSSVLQATRLALSPPVTRFEIGVCTDVAKQHDTARNSTKQHLSIPGTQSQIGTPLRGLCGERQGVVA